MEEQRLSLEPAISHVSEEQNRREQKYCSNIQLNKDFGGPNKDLHVWIERAHRIPEKS